jgi:hypothetical protein
MLQLGFEPMIQVFERAKTFHALDLTATVIGLDFVYVTAKACIIIKYRSYTLKLGFKKQC